MMGGGGLIALWAILVSLTANHASAIDCPSTIKKQRKDFTELSKNIFCCLI